MLLITNYFWAFLIKLNYLLFNLFLFKDSNWTSRIEETDEKVFVEYLNSEESVCDVGIYRNVENEGRKVVGSVGERSKSNLDSTFCQDNSLSAEQVRIPTNKIRLSSQLTG